MVLKQALVSEDHDHVLLGSTRQLLPEKFEPTIEIKMSANNPALINFVTSPIGDIINSGRYFSPKHLPLLLYDSLIHF